MARAHRELITIEFKHNTDHYSEYQITEHEAESLFFALQEVLDIDWGSKPDEGEPILKSEWETLVDALKSIATSSCCGDCQEAKRVAEVALYKVGLVDDIPVRGTLARDWELYYSNLYMAVAQQFQGSYGLKMSAADWDSLRRNFPNPTKV